MASVVASCDSAPADLVQEIDAARDGCTEEMLKASDEICVRMFEKYADMAADGMETYIGGMRAFDEAIQRRGGLQFDTAGLGSAVGERWRAGADSAGIAPGGGVPGLRPDRAFSDPERDPRTSSPQGAFEEQNGYADGMAGSTPGGRWSDPLPTGSAGVGSFPYPSPANAGRPAPGATAPVRRGALLPPEERLRRPWIDAAGADDPYVEAIPSGRGGESAPQVRSPGWEEEAYPDRRGGNWDGY